jgi:hypothetical protein
MPTKTRAEPTDDAATMARIRDAIDPDYPERDAHASHVFSIVRQARNRARRRYRRGIRT